VSALEEIFRGRHVRVKCCSGYEVEGVLVDYGLSRHGRRHPEDYGKLSSVGTLVLFKEAFPRDCSGWILVKCWTVITCDH
jgi:hypothetical protein